MWCQEIIQASHWFMRSDIDIVQCRSRVTPNIGKEVCCSRILVIFSSQLRESTDRALLRETHDPNPHPRRSPITYQSFEKSILAVAAYLFTQVEYEFSLVVEDDLSNRWFTHLSNMSKQVMMSFTSCPLCRFGKHPFSPTSSPPLNHHGLEQRLASHQIFFRAQDPKQPRMPYKHIARPMMPLILAWL